MPDTGFHIVTTTDDAGVKKFVDNVNAGKLSLAEFNKQLRELKNAAVPGSQSLKDLNDIQYQVRESSKSAEIQERSLTNVIRESRQERRLYMFAVTETLQAISSAVGKENQFAKAISGGASAVFGMRFALDALGGTAARISGPLSLIFGAWIVLRELFNSSADAAKKFNEELTEQNKTITELIEKLYKLGQVTRDQLRNLYLLQLEGLKSAAKLIKTTEVKTQLIEGPGGSIKGSKFITVENSEGVKEKNSNLNQQAELLLKIQALDKQDVEDQKKKSDEIAKQRKDLEKSSQEAWSLAEAFRVAINALEPKGKKTSMPLVDEKSTGKTFGEALGGEFDVAAKSAQQFTRVLDQGISQSTNLLADGFKKAFGLGQSLASQLLAQMLSIAAQMAETYALETAAKALTAGATGNIFTALGAMLFDSGGWIQEPVVGRGLASGRPYGFAMNGQPEKVSTLNQMGQASRYGGASSQPYVQVFPIINSAGLAVQVEIGNQQNKRLRN